MWKAWVLAARPKTLSAAVVPVAVATALVPGAVNWLLFSCALLGAVFIQIGTNLVNDAIDFRKGADTAERLGPVRVTQAGLISPATVMLAAWGCFAIAAVCGIPLLIRGGWPLLAIGLTSIAAAYLYTGGPYPLAYHGLGEIFVVLFFGLVAVSGSYYLQTLALEPHILLAGVGIGSLATVLLVINNLRDVAGDRSSNKRTLIVRFGERFGRAEVAALLLLAYGAQIGIAATMRDPWLLLPLATLPVAALLLERVIRSSGRDLNRCLAQAGLLQWAFGVLFVVGAVL